MTQGSGRASPVCYWLQYADHEMAPLRRSRRGSITPVMDWLLYADHRMDPICRSVTPTIPVIVTTWNAAFCTETKTPTGTRELRTLKEENEQLKRELVRKEKALSEAAALLILQKKFRALWEDEVK
jgi:hypothetical protein